MHLNCKSSVLLPVSVVLNAILIKQKNLKKTENFLKEKFLLFYIKIKKC